MLRFELLEAPRRDGEVLIEPPAASWPDLIEHTIRSRARDEVGLELTDVPVQTVRQETRDRLFGTGTVEPIIACGHQPEFAHPGVWAKHVVVRHLAGRLGVHGVDLVVDHDAPRSTAVTTPTYHADVLALHRVPVLTGTAGSAYEGRPPLSPSAIERVLREVNEQLLPALRATASPCPDPRSRGLSANCATGSPGPEPGSRGLPASAVSDSPLIDEYCRGIAQAERPVDFVEQHLAGRQRVDQPFAATLQEVRVSKAFDGPFVADILLNLDRFARAYNESLTEYRREQHVRSVDRPLPDLKSTGDRREAPFWIYEPHHQRERLWVSSRGDALDLYAGSRPVDTLSRADLLQHPACALASLAPWAIRPRALSLTLWARLLVCELFVHGIGGAKYDRVTDGIFRRYYRCEPPGYACVTATLRLPLPRYPVTTADLAAARRRVRDLHFNPQRYLEHLPADLLAERDRLIGESRELREQLGSALQRRAVFVAIRQISARLAEFDPALKARFEHDLERTGRQLASNAVTDSREFFYALQPRGRLEMLAGRLIEATRGVAVQI